jgi:hypothetical protein
MILRQIINKSTYATVGYINSSNDIGILEGYINYNLEILNEFENIIVATNYTNYDEFSNLNTELWKKYFPNCILLDSKINRGHSFGTADLDNMIFDYCKKSDINWLCKASNDIILNESVLNIEIEEADLYYLNGISYETLYLNGFDYNKIHLEHFYPQTNFYILNISKCDYLCDKKFLDETYEYSKTIPNYSGKIWEYINGWSCEDFLKNCAIRNKLSKFYLLNKDNNNKLCEVIHHYKIGDPSHKNIFVNGVCHFQYPGQNVIEI